MHKGDVLMVTRIDRLARDPQDIVRSIRAKGSSRQATRAAAGKCFLDMLGVFAEFETDLQRRNAS
jgi:DNA invertase Pin-like site-specific DNA recombinase